MTKPLERKTKAARERAGREVWARVQRGARVALPDVRRFVYRGLIAEPLKPLARWAEVELAELLADKGDGVTAAERAALDTGRPERAAAADARVRSGGRARRD